MIVLKRWLQKLSLILGGVFGGIVIAELGFRIADISYPNFYTYDEHRAFALRPGASGWWRREGEAYVQINSDGLRDREHQKAKPEDTFRVAILGDSMAEAREVPREKAFWAVMERELNQCGAFNGKNVEVINFGVRNYGTAQELLTLRYHVWDYSPDIVLLAFFVGNDIRNNSKVLEPDKYRPFFTYSGNNLVLDNSFRQSTTSRLLKSYPGQLAWSFSHHSRAVQVLREAILRMHHNRKISLQRDMNAESGIAYKQTETGIDYKQIYVEPTDPVWQEAWRITEELIVMMGNGVKERGADFLAVTLSITIQVYPDPSIRQEFMRELGISDLFYPDRRIKTLGEREGFTVLNLAPSFQYYAEKNQVCLHGFDNADPCGGHWNIEGHRLAGQTIAQKLCQEQWKLQRMSERATTIN